MRIVLALSIVAALGAAARAQSSGPLLQPDLAGRSQAGVETHYVSFGGDNWLFTTEGLAEWAFVPGTLVGSLRVPLALANRPPGGDCCDAALGNVVAGARWVGGAARTRWGAELGLGLPTASDGEDRFYAAEVAGTANLPHDPGRWLPYDLTSARLDGYYAVAEPGGAFVQADVGFQYWYLGDPGQSDWIARLGVAGGGELSTRLALVAELTTVLSTAPDRGVPDELYHAIDLGVRYRRGGVTVRARLYVPLDEELRDTDTLGLGLDVTWWPATRRGER